jgi:hypothetical protein
MTTAVLVLNVVLSTGVLVAILALLARSIVAQQRDDTGRRARTMRAPRRGTAPRLPLREALPREA